MPIQYWKVDFPKMKVWLALSFGKGVSIVLTSSITTSMRLTTRIRRWKTLLWCPLETKSVLLFLSNDGDLHARKCFSRNNYVYRVQIMKKNEEKFNTNMGTMKVLIRIQKVKYFLPWRININRPNTMWKSQRQIRGMLTSCTLTLT